MSRRENAEVPEEQNQGNMMCVAVGVGSGTPEMEGIQGEVGDSRCSGGTCLRRS